MGLQGGQCYKVTTLVEDQVILKQEMELWEGPPQPSRLIMGPGVSQSVETVWTYPKANLLRYYNQELWADRAKVPGATNSYVTR